MIWLLILPIRTYQLLLSPWLGHSCRFEPTCFAYAIKALEVHGPLHGHWLTIHLLMRCNPWGGCGCDPVPAAAKGKPPARLQRKA
ncbi:MAG: membrane protein insertion efficiency factor YidD [Porticoccaceae bacterium]|nr:membrane protein insertion efficiency factor YidD [Porticoccaceae bacterium]